MKSLYLVIVVIFTVCLHLVKGTRDLCGVSSIKTLLPFLRAPPSCPKNFLKSSPPSTIIFGVWWFQHTNGRMGVTGTNIKIIAYIGFLIAYIGKWLSLVLTFWIIVLQDIDFSSISCFHQFFLKISFHQMLFWWLYNVIKDSGLPSSFSAIVRKLPLMIVRDLLWYQVLVPHWTVTKARKKQMKLNSLYSFKSLFYRENIISP